MGIIDDTRQSLSISRSGGILRRYFVVNGFDGALTMLGLIIGFLAGGSADLQVMINTCVAAAIALGMSGLSSAYVSEVAERKRELDQLQEAMITDLQDTAHGRAARRVPLLVALVNGAAPLCISLLILLPLWLARAGLPLPLEPLAMAIATALGCIFGLGLFLGRVGGTSPLGSGVKAVLIALVTIGLVRLVGG